VYKKTEREMVAVIRVKMLKGNNYQPTLLARYLISATVTKACLLPRIAMVASCSYD
jgi:hypothetical protein